MEVTTAELADLVGVTPKSVREWVKAGLPTTNQGRTGRGATHKFDSAIAIQWMIDRAIAERVGADPDGEYFDSEQEQARLNHYRANVEQLKEQQLRAELIPWRDVVEICAAHVGAARAQILSIHSKVRTRFPKLEQKIVDEIEQFATGALAELGRNGLPDGLRKRLAGDRRDLDAAAEAVAEPVGRRKRPRRRADR